MNQQIRAAIFRPDDDRVERAVELPDSSGATPVPDPMLAIEPIGVAPEPGAFVVLTSKIGVELLDEAGWDPGDATSCCISPATTDITRDAGWTVDRIPDEYTLAGLIDHLTPDADGATVEVVRSDHGSAVLVDGLRDAGAGVHRTVLYRLAHPKGAGESAELAAVDDLRTALFISSLTVKHFLNVIAGRGICEGAIADLNDAVASAVEPPTRDTAESHDIDVTAVPDEATFEALAIITAETATSTYCE